MNVISINYSDFSLTTPYIGSTFNDSPYSIYPLMLSFEKLNGIGTSSIFINFTTSLFLPPINSGPKLTFPTLINTFGSLTIPIIRKYLIIFYEGISKVQ